MILVLMGVAGAGKTTVGRQLAAELGWTFVDADDFHPPANVEAMRAGVPLTEAARAPWLAALAQRLQAAATAHEDLVLACSALKRSYRQTLTAGLTAIGLVHLHGTPETLRARLAGRQGHYAGPELLDSQLAALESPGSEVLSLDIAAPPAELVRAIREHWQL